MRRRPAGLRALRLLLLGETVIVPAGIVVLIGVALLARELAPELWRHAGAAVVPMITLAVLALATRGRRG